jgi:NADPH:quinone reductase-like Zn-dependent oxidoreductase
MADTMKIYMVKEYGGPEKLELEEQSLPEPGPGEVLIEMQAAGVNPIDWKLRSGLYKDFMPLSFPWTPGIDGAGMVRAVGPNAATFKQGQGVFGLINGAYAEYAIADAEEIFPIPDPLTFDQAAAVPIGALTAWKAVMEDADIKPGQHVLICGAAGGVGNFAVQFARLQGARVTGTCSALNLEFVRSLGAERAVDYRSSAFEKLVKDVDVVLDTVGGETLERACETVKKGGLVLTIAGNPPREKAAKLGIRVERSGRTSPDRLARISGLIESGKVVPTLGRIFPFAAARDAQALSQTGHGRGRIILHMSHRK